MEQLPIVFAWILLFLVLYLAYTLRTLQQEFSQKEKASRRRMYELAILKELGDRIGYSLNIEKITDIITGSLKQFLEYTCVAYMLLEPEKIIYKVQLEKSVTRKFIDEVRNKMLESLSALLDTEYKKEQVEETLSGAILVDELDSCVQSIFNIPLVIGNKVVGVLTVADTNIGLYKEEEMTILYKIIGQASNAVTRLQDVVATEQRKLNAMVESMAEGVVMTDKDYRLMVVNPAAKRVIGKEQTPEITIFDFIDILGSSFDIRGKLEESVKLDKLLIEENAYIRDRFYQITVSPVKARMGLHKEEIMGGVVLLHDITREKELEKLREDFTSMIVHELRSPLSNIRGTSDMLIRRKDQMPVEDVTGSLKIMESTSFHMLTLINDLLDVAKLESGKFTIYKKQEELNAIILSVLEEFDASIKEKGLTISTRLDSTLPPIPIDRNRIEQVMRNLLSNAIKFTPTGEITIVTKRDGDHASIAVSDTGIGIAEPQIPLLFNKFKQFQPNTLNRQGTGLGLVIIKGIVQNHGGTVRVESKIDHGSTFTFTLPIS